MQVRSPIRSFIATILGLGLVACGNPVPGASGTSSDPSASKSAAPGGADDAKAVAPPFAVRGELDGLLIVWFDEQGTHTASRRSDVPEAHRARVRVDSLAVAPDKRRDPEHVYVADLTAPAKDGAYSVHETTRAAFDAQVLAARPAAPPPSAAEQGKDVTIYMASWCGACRATAKYLTSRHVPFSERDIEKDADANAEMMRKAQAAGKRPSGVPVIDFRGHLILGFDRDALARLIDEGSPI